MRTMRMAQDVKRHRRRDLGLFARFLQGPLLMRAPPNNRLSTLPNGFTRRQGLVGCDPAVLEKAWFRRAFRIVRMRFAVALRLRRVSSPSGVSLVAGRTAWAFVCTRFGQEACWLRQRKIRSAVRSSTSTGPSSGRMASTTAYLALRLARGPFSASSASR